MLSKRKTPNMRLMEQTKEEGRERRQTVVDRRERRERFCVRPDPAQLNFEKRLRKVATSGSAWAAGAEERRGRTQGLTRGPLQLCNCSTQCASTSSR